MTQQYELPPLPDVTPGKYGFHSSDMHDYAHQAIALDRQGRGEPVVMGLGKYVINHSAASEPPQLIISTASDEDRSGRKVGESRDNEPGKTIDPCDMAVRIFFENAQGLDAIETQLRFLRETHFPGTAPQPAAPAVKESLTVAEPMKEVSDADILHIWDSFVGEPSDKYPLTDADKIGFANAILARYGSKS